MANAATLFLKSLDEEQTKAAMFEFDDELRKDWQFIPMERKGLGLKSMKPNQHHLAMSLVQSALSHRGFSTSMQIMALEQVLHEMEKQNPKRDAAKYHVFFFGKPATDSTWGWRIEGHHLSISFTLVEGKTVVTTPAFFGTNPAEVRQGKLAGLRPLGEEEDLARSLVKKLTVEQKEKAILKIEAPSDVINGPGRVAEPLTPSGIAATEMTEEQTKILRQLVAVYLGKFRTEIAMNDWKKISEAGFEKVHFAWAGKIGIGKPHYFRVQGPTFIMEYDNTQNKANHAHAVWRDFKNDFGEDLLKKHYESVPHEGNK
ncbi:MAG: DUF3500 domain-containing protein [Mariniblastus sp.]